MPQKSPAEWIITVDDIWAKPRLTSEAQNITEALKIADSAMRSDEHPVVEIRIKRIFQPGKPPKE